MDYGVFQKMITSTVQAQDSRRVMVRANGYQRSFFLKLAGGV
jgi:hypothetical protein